MITFNINDENDFEVMNSLELLEISAANCLGSKIREEKLNINKFKLQVSGGKIRIIVNGEDNIDDCVKNCYILKNLKFDIIIKYEK